MPQPATGRPDLRVVDVHALEPCTAHSAARQIAEHTGCTRAEAEQMVGRYLDEVSEQVGCSVHQWGLDPHDLAAILTDNGHQVAGDADLPDPLQRAAHAVADAEHTTTLATTAEQTAEQTAEHAAERDDQHERTDDGADGADGGAHGWGS